MPDSLMPNLIERISGLLAKATAAPWFTDDRSFGDDDDPPYGPYGYISTPGRRGKPILQAIHSRKVNDDLRLTAELRNAAPAIMDALKDATAFVKQLSHKRGCPAQRLEVDDRMCTCGLTALRSKLAALEEL